jgi:hypothetical protein
MNKIKAYQIVVIGEESEILCDRSIGYEYESISRLHHDDLIESGISTIFTIGILSESGTLSDDMPGSDYGVFPGFSRMLRPESIMRAGSPIGYDRVVSSSLTDSYR